MSLKLAIDCVSTESLVDLLKLLVRTSECSEWVNCDNTQDSVESIVKRLISEADDGTLAINVCFNGGVDIDTLNVDEITYTDTYWEDMQISQGMFEFAGVNDPTLINYDIGGSGMVVKMYEFAKNDEAFWMIQIPHKLKVGSSLHLHLHWTPGANGVAESGKYVGWKAQFLLANINTAFPAVLQTADLRGLCDGVNHKHLLSQDAVFNLSPNISGFIVGRVYREDTGGDDTWAGAVTGSLPIFLGIDFHYEIDSPGSREEYIK